MHFRDGGKERNRFSVMGNILGYVFTIHHIFSFASL